MSRLPVNDIGNAALFAGTTDVYKRQGLSNLEKIVENLIKYGKDHRLSGRVPLVTTAAGVRGCLLYTSRCV